MRIAVTGKTGQVVQSLMERSASTDIDLVPVGRPEVDLRWATDLTRELHAVRPSAVISAAAYTAVDLAESEPAVAEQINAVGAEIVARAAARVGIPIIHLSTDYVFSGSLGRAYREDDIADPVNVYGRSKLHGERLVAGANPDHVIIRTAWIYSPFGKNFARTMLSLAATRNEISVVSDQYGTPTNALDIADGIFVILRNLIANPDHKGMRGVFHMTSDGRSNWAEFATAIFTASAACGGPSALVRPILSSAYPTAARRPVNSLLNSTKLERIHGVRLPPWGNSLPATVARIVATGLQ